ncbi:hypothetical protein AB205_0200630 [Aquarana catesbeiana]|uniref:Uncharacterized protein n=1 Tax=Aquarana catesbeiana TaxID=8400 RepID=A0A2G9RKA3_AQUCT|nr:hypothetical protein AB205_0200630 [Aquarana catesbeiana]
MLKSISGLIIPSTIMVFFTLSNTQSFISDFSHIKIKQKWYALKENRSFCFRTRKILELVPSEIFVQKVGICCRKLLTRYPKIV